MASWDEMWSGLKEGISNGLEEASKVGIPVIKASVEQSLLNTLKDQNKATQSEVDAAIKTLSSNPSSPIGQGVAATIQNTVLANYGGLILVGVIGLGFMGFMLGRK